MSDIYQQPSLFDAQDAAHAPTDEVVERVRPDGIPEEAWVLMEASRRRSTEQEPFSIRDLPAPPETGSWGAAARSAGYRYKGDQK